MSTPTPGRRQARPLLQATPVAAACAALLCAAGGAQAQDAAAPAATPASTVITVTGIRRGIESAINVKKNADGVVEAISAEDVGKLPDTTVAEAISRLPGLATQRNKATGRASNISVRGLSPDFNAATLNGREQASTGDSRGVEFDQFPAELLSGVQVYKTPQASLAYQGLASTINMSTVRPLDFSKRTIAGRLTREKTGVDSGFGEGSGDRATLTYIDQFADRKLGIALGFTTLKDKGADQQRFNAWGGWAPDVTGCSGAYDAGGVCQGTESTGRVPGGFTSDLEKTNFERTGGMAVVQYKHSKDLEVSLDYFYSEGDFRASKKGLEGAVGGNSAGGYDPNGRFYNVTRDANGNFTSGTLDNYKGVVRNHEERIEDDLTAWGANVKFRLGQWANAVDVSQSTVNRKGTRYETTAGLVGNGNLPQFAAAHRASTISWQGFTGGNFDQVRYNTSLNYSDPAVIKLTDPMGWSGGESSPQAGYVALPTVKDEIDAIRLSGKRAVEFGPIIEVDVGVNLSDRQKSRTANEGRLVIRGSVDLVTGVVLDPYAFRDVPGAGVGVAGSTGLPIITWDPQGSLGVVYDLPPKVDRDILNKDWGVKEDIKQAYVQGNIDTELFGRQVRGNVGVQIVDSQQSGSGFVLDPANCTGNTPATCPATRVDIPHSYTDVLPTLNLSMDLPSDSVVRLAVGKVMSRASMGDLRASSTFGVNAAAQGGPRIEGSGGNPFLEPFRATNFDLSFEKYFGTRAYIAVAGFYKDLRTYVYQQTLDVDFSRYGVALPPGVSAIGKYIQPANGTGGSISGAELTVSVPFGMFASVLNGFGVEINHSSNTSKVTIPTSGLNTNDVGVSQLPLPGLSKNVTNFRLYYERAGFGISFAQRKRSEFLGEISDFQDNRQLTFVAPETTQDVQISYEFQGGLFKGLSLLAQGKNLSNAEFKRYSGTPDNIVERVKYGKTYAIGAAYKF
jgi:iron complex outermembrane receptor protein